MCHFYFTVANRDFRKVWNIPFPTHRRNPADPLADMNPAGEFPARHKKKKNRKKKSFDEETGTRRYLAAGTRTGAQPPSEHNVFTFVNAAINHSHARRGRKTTDEKESRESARMEERPGTDFARDSFSLHRFSINLPEPVSRSAHRLIR